MKVFCSIMIWVCLIFLCAESPNLTSFIIVKPVAAVLLLVFGMSFYVRRGRKTQNGAKRFCNLGVFNLSVCHICEAEFLTA